MEFFNILLGHINDILWHDYVLYTVLAVGVLFLIWSKFSPWMSLTHGVQVVRGKYDHSDDPGAISHFEALSAALSATVGLGNIGGVALAISLGGPGAVFWMWVVGFLGMAIKTVEVNQSMLYRNVSDKDDPHGGPMWVVSKGLEKFNLGFLGKVIGYIFCITLLISTCTGGNLFQAWNVGDIMKQNFGVNPVVTGIILCGICGAVIIGGIKRIGAVAGSLVPLMCGLYLITALFVVALNIQEVPAVFRLIFSAAFSPLESQGAFIGGTFGYAFLWGMKRAIFSNEAAQGSAPIAHSAARTDEPVREGIVAGLEPFVDTIVVCTLTALVILTSGVWNRDASVHIETAPLVAEVETGKWQVEGLVLPDSGKWTSGMDVFMIVSTGIIDHRTGSDVKKVHGTVNVADGLAHVEWAVVNASKIPEFKQNNGIFVNYKGAALTSYAFDQAYDGLGLWLVTIASWLFAVSTIISWSYYGEQGVIFMVGSVGVLPYRLGYCLLTIVANIGLIRTNSDLDNITGFGTGMMLIANLPIIMIFSFEAMRAYHKYCEDLKAGKFKKTS